MLAIRVDKCLYHRDLEGTPSATKVRIVNETDYGVALRDDDRHGVYTRVFVLLVNTGPVLDASVSACVGQRTAGYSTCQPYIHPFWVYLGVPYEVFHRVQHSFVLRVLCVVGTWCCRLGASASANPSV